ncbi:MAG: 16S rRNA (uracil(1498)-N(3))-methyltransferase [Deferribacteres bacterium]|nr:16S rRNA (uracil(1498)-N(3))-methyltransferase [Deferribacteres bacterium]
MSELTVFIPEELREKEWVNIPEEELKHLKVRRAKEGAEITILNGKGFEAKARLHLKEKKAHIEQVKDITYRELPIKVNLYQGVLKSDKMDWVIQKATELGVSSITPLITSRTVAKVKREKRVRWQKIAQEALKQCRRAVLPEINQAVSVKEARWEGECLLLWENSKKGLKEALIQLPELKELNIIVGPEGGFSREEAELLIKKGAKDVSIGEVILRSETASVYILSVIKFLGKEHWRP